MNGIGCSTWINIPEVPSKAVPAADRVESTVKESDAAKTGNIDQTTDDDGSKPEQIESSTRKRRVRISVKNLLRVIRTSKRASGNANRNSNAARRSSIEPRRSSVVERKSSIDPKSNSVEPASDPKPFKCIVHGCSFASAHKRNLPRHMKIHEKDAKKMRKEI